MYVLRNTVAVSPPWEAFVSGHENNPLPSGSLSPAPLLHCDRKRGDVELPVRTGSCSPTSAAEEENATPNAPVSSDELKECPLLPDSRMSAIRTVLSSRGRQLHSKYGGTLQTLDGQM